MTKRISLGGSWDFLGEEAQLGPPAEVGKPGDSGWLPIGVPGDVNAALLAHGKIPDPSYDVRGRDCYWVTSKDWWYRRRFDAEAPPDRSVFLCLACIDGPADLWLNGSYLGEAANAFRPFRFDVTGHLRGARNELLIRFRSIDGLLGGPRVDEIFGWKQRRAWLRKPQFNFGWDWALPLPSIGLGGEVWLEAAAEYAFVGHSIQPFASGRVDCDFEVTKGARDKGYRIAATIEGHGSRASGTIDRAAHRSYTSFQIDRPRLWFPNGYGEPALYDCTFELLVDGTPVDRLSGKVGIREVRTAERPFTPEAGPGFSFEIEVNGVPIFCKGSNWVPLELWPATAKSEQYEHYLRAAREANFNMLRVWGGGVYEPDLFYDLCDELGIMVWQDFMFASAGYPVDLLREEIIREAEYQIGRLRNHPSIVLWCGINEDVFSWEYPERRREDTQRDDGLYAEEQGRWQVDRLRDDPQIYTMMLRGLVGKLALGVPYVESSPQSRDDYGNIRTSGNCHISTWKQILFVSGGSAETWREHFATPCSFDSEFAMAGPCSRDHFERMMAPENLWPPNEAWIYHFQRSWGNVPLHEYMMKVGAGLFGEIHDLHTFIKHVQASHLELLRAEYEAARYDRPNSGGTMGWMYNDCWPTGTWSIIDYYREPKPAYYAAKRACAPLLPIVFERAGLFRYAFSNETAEDVQVDLMVGQERLDGTKVWEQSVSALARANSVTPLVEKARADLRLGPTDFLFAGGSWAGGEHPRSTYFPDSWKDVPWPAPQPTLEPLGRLREGRKWRTRFRVSSDTYVRLCHLLPRVAGTEVRFSDNYFDLPARDARDVEVVADRTLEVADLRVHHWKDWPR